MEQKKLTRSTSDKKLCGVCGGLAKYLDVDPTVIRLAVVVLTFLTAIIAGIVLYLLCVIIMPEGE